MTAPSKPRILFVDDDPSILGGLENVFHRDRGRWELEFAGSGDLALDRLRARHFDVVVTDMRMPGMTGDQLLQRVRAEFPAVVRIILSGQSDREAIARALPAIHQLLSKPCTSGTIRSTIERSLDCAMVAADARIAALIGRIDSLPSPPSTYFELQRLTESPSSTVKDVAKCVLGDPGLSAKVLQLVNSAYFGARQPVSGLEQAVGLLGSERLRYLALSSAVFTGTDREVYEGVTIEQMQQASLQTAIVTKTLLTGSEADDGFAAGLLHDIGHLILAFGMPTEYAAVKAAQRDFGMLDQSPVERELLGVSHGEVGAWLLALWGVPNRIVDVVRYHHDPSAALPENRVIASAVHVADVLTFGGSADNLDHASLARAGTAAMIAPWLTKAAGAGL